MATQSYASLPELRAAIRFRRKVRFSHKGIVYKAEPQALRHAVRTSALVLDAWVLEGDQPGWKTFRYSEMREMQILDEAFIPRDLAPDRKRLIVVAA